MSQLISRVIDTANILEEVGKMYGLRYSEQVDEMSKRDFAVLCVTLLKIEVSHEVQQVSTQGSDGLRDAWLEGYNRRSGLYGKWVFQFKQYSSELSVARKRMINDFTKEMNKTFQYYKNLTGYVFITNVPHSGTSRQGTFDKVSAIISEMEHEEKVIQFWDGQELCNLIDLHYAKVAHLVFPERTMNSSILLSDDFTFLLEDDMWEETRSETDVMYYTDSLVGATGEILLSPQNNSNMTQLYFQGKFHEMINLGMICRNMLFPYREQQKFQYLSLTLLVALAYARVGKIGLSKKLLKAFDDLNCNDSLLWGYYFDIQSLLAEKENNYSIVSECTDKGWKLYNEHGIYFNLIEWKLRQIHKIDWNACEREERTADNNKFKNALQLCDKEMQLTQKERQYIKAMKAVYSALHYTWEEDYLEDAEDQIIIGINYFKEINCLPELARLSSEKGRIQLKSVYGSKDSIKNLKEGLNYRIRTGEMGRVRYDLVWLGQAYLQRQNEYYATLVSVVSEYIHYHILGFNLTTDIGLLKKIGHILKNNRLKEFVCHVKKTESFYADLECATDVSVVFWIQIVNIKLLLIEMEEKC